MAPRRLAASSEQRGLARVAAALRICMPPIWMERLPQVVPWSGVSAVSPWMSLIMAQRHVELLGDDLRQRRRDAGAEIDLAGIDRHHALGVDREEGVDLGERDRLGCRALRRSPHGQRPASEKLTTRAPPPLSTSRREV